MVLVRFRLLHEVGIGCGPQFFLCIIKVSRGAQGLGSKFRLDRCRVLGLGLLVSVFVGVCRCLGVFLVLSQPGGRTTFSPDLSRLGNNQLNFGSETKYN